MPCVMTVNDTAYNKHLPGFLWLFSLWMVFRHPVASICLYHLSSIDNPGDFGIEDSCEAGAEAGKKLPWTPGVRNTTSSLCLDWYWRGFRRVRQTCTLSGMGLCGMGLCAQPAIYRCTPKIHIEVWSFFFCTLFYAVYHVQHDCNLSSVLLRSSSASCYFNSSPRDIC